MHLKESHDHQHGLFNHHHDHSHDGDHSSKGQTFKRALIAGIVINMIYVCAEFLAGIVFDSVGLLSDAGHNLSDVASLILSLAAVIIAGRSISKGYTYGYGKSTILASLLNSIILLGTVAFIVYESIEKFSNPRPVTGSVIAWVAALGILVNAATAFLFFSGKDKDLNIKGAWLHMIADALVSSGVVLSGIVISLTGWSVIDPVIGLMIAGVILASTWELLRESFRLTLDGVPQNFDIDKITEMMKSVSGVVEVHHLHLWALSTSETAMTAHLVVSELCSVDEITRIKDQVKSLLKEEGITHATLETEPDNQVCESREHTVSDAD